MIMSFLFRMHEDRGWRRPTWFLFGLAYAPVAAALLWAYFTYVPENWWPANPSRDRQGAIETLRRAMEMTPQSEGKRVVGKADHPLPVVAAGSIPRIYQHVSF